jgi:hypothetical protein
MPKRPDVGAIAEQVIERLKQSEHQVIQNERIADELGRLRDAVTDLERAILSRSNGERVPAAEPIEPAPEQGAAKRSSAADRSGAATRPALVSARSHRAARTRPRSLPRWTGASR